MSTPDLDDVETGDDGVRYYHWDDGASYPSVTTVVNSDPEKQRKMAEWERTTPGAAAYRDRQGLLGSLVHHRILDRYAIRSLDPPPVDFDVVDDDIPTDVEVAEVMWDDLGIDIGASPFVEKAVRHNTHEYSGRFDLLTEDGRLIDLKVSKRPFDSHKVQLAAYARAINDQHTEYPDVDRATVVILHPHADVNPTLTARTASVTGSALETHFATFERLLDNFS